MRAAWPIARGSTPEFRHAAGSDFQSRAVPQPLMGIQGIDAHLLEWGVLGATISESRDEAATG